MKGHPSFTIVVVLQSSNYGKMHLCVVSVSTPRCTCIEIPDKVDGRTTAAVLQLVDHRVRYSKVAGSVLAGGKFSFHTLEFLYIYTTITTTQKKIETSSAPNECCTNCKALICLCFPCVYWLFSVPFV